MRIGRVERIGILTVCLFVLLIIAELIQMLVEGVWSKLVELIGHIIQTVLIGLVVAFLIIKGKYE
jgi:hypothetical protein